MKRCPACQRTYPDDHLTFCLDDGAALWIAESDSSDSTPTMRIPGPRVTDQPQPPLQHPSPPPVYAQPVYAQPAAGTGFKLNNRVLGITGASLVIVGVLMPLVSFLGLIGFSYIQIAQMRAQFFTGYILPLLGGLGLFLALKSQYRPLIGIGVAVLAILLLDYFRIRSEIASLPLGLPGARTGAPLDPLAGQYLQNVIQISWGFFALVAGGILLIVAGVKKEKTPTNSSYWNRNPPPPANYT